MLKRVRKNGAFLVRKKESDQPSSEQSEMENQSESQNESFAISFRYVMAYVLVQGRILVCIFQTCKGAPKSHCLVLYTFFFY